MFMGVEHGGFIFASFLFTALVFALLIIFIYAHLSHQKKRLHELEASGVTRRKRKARRAKGA